MKLNIARLLVLLWMTTSCGCSMQDPTAVVHNAARDGKIASIERFLKDGGSPDYRNEYQETLLHVAARAGQVEVMQLLLEHGADVNARDEDQKTPLHFAVDRPRSGVVAVLVAAGADTSLRDWHDSTPMDLVGTVSVIRELSKKPNPDEALEYAAAAGSMAELRSLLSKPESSSEAPEALRAAVKADRLEVVCFLLKEGVAVNAHDLHIAVDNNSIEIGRCLLAHGADVHAMTEFLGSPLHHAAVDGHREFAELLLANGADINLRNESGSTPLGFARKEGHKELADYLKSKGGLE